jgi:hypothetical protein
MSLDKKITDALRDPKSGVMAVEMTGEVKERISRITCEMIDELAKRTKGPHEGYMVLHFLMAYMEKQYGIRGAAVAEDEAHGST